MSGKRGVRRSYQNRHHRDLSGHGCGFLVSEWMLGKSMEIASHGNLLITGAQGSSQLLRELLSAELQHSSLDDLGK